MKLFLVTALTAAGVLAQNVDLIPTPAPLVTDALNFQVVTTANRLTTFVGGSVVKNRAFSATEENRSLQVLGNGAKIENNSKTKLYRDAEGRTRTEDAQGNITINDPVAGFRATLNPKTKVATKGPTGAFGYTYGLPVNVANTQVYVRNMKAGSMGSELKEGLGLQSVNGVTARGERVTVAIPKGEIGNDRELKVITERWTSEELQMLVKSTNSDPRYGDTTYELTGISLAAPDPALFQIPGDYTVSESGRGAAIPKAAATPGTARGGRSK